MPKTKNQKLVVDITESDCQDLANGVKFDWTFETDKGESIDLHVFNPEAE